MGPPPAAPTPATAPPAAPRRGPWIALVIVGGLAVIAGLVGATLVALGEAPTSAAATYGVMAAAGGGLLLIGLVGLAVAAIRAKRRLPAERYRGPSIFVLLLIVLVAGNIVSGLFLLDDLGALAAGGGDLPALAGTVLLLLTPASFIAASVLFVVLPNGLAGFRLTDGHRTLANVIAGVLLGIGAWVAVALLSAGLEWVARQLGQPVEGQQMVADLLANVPAWVALPAATLIVPFGEELFFRGMALNAWQREYGPRRGLWGSALLFTAIHVPDGGFLIIPPILLLSLVLGITYQRTRSLPMVVGLHGAFNAISTLLLVLASS